jgi:hypothetical protein
VRLFSLSLFALFLVACDGPCEVLAERICSCEPNVTEEAGCLEQVRAEMERFVPSDAETKSCDALLDADGCTCEAIEAEQFHLCGLSVRGE